MTSTPVSVRYRFGRFELQPEERRLLADGVAVRIGPHAFDLLAVLVERSGHLVTKDELLARVWHQVVVEDTLQVHVAAIRSQLLLRSNDDRPGVLHTGDVPDRMKEPWPDTHGKDLI